MHQRAILITRTPIPNKRIQIGRIIVIITTTGAVLRAQTLNGKCLVLVVGIVTETIGMAVGVCIGSIEPEAGEESEGGAAEDEGRYAEG